MSAQFIICKASAGSGKTFTLVKEYLKLAFNGSSDEQLQLRFKRILAITFTNKAANEMKERILRYLEEIQSSNESSMAEVLCQELDTDRTQLSHKAYIVQTAIIHNYSDLAVCTIDSFMSHLVKTFAHDLHLPTNFEVMTDSEQLLDDAMDEFMALIGSNDEQGLNEVVCTYANAQMDEGKSFNIEASLKKTANELFGEEAPTYLKKIEDIQPRQFIELHQQYLTDNKKLEQEVSELASIILKKIKDNGLRCDHFYRKTQGIYSTFDKWSKGELARPNTYASDFINNPSKRYAKEANTSEREAIDRLFPDIENGFNSITQKLNEELPLYNTRQALLKNLFSLALLNRLNTIILNYSHKNEIVHISEFNKKIADVVQEEPMPFIYERIGSHYDNYLIDEFQDTSKLQWTNLVPLVENGVASNHTSLVVGDSKQAIYRFRQGDVQQFIDLPKVDNKPHGALFCQPGISRFVPLGTNFRSHKCVVEFNNLFYKWIATNPLASNKGIQKAYIGSDASHPELSQQWKKDGGYVQVGFWDTANGEESITVLLDPIETTIEEQLEKGYSFSDIAILARDNKTLDIIANHLTQKRKQKGLTPFPIISSQSFIITNSRAVLLIRATLQYLQNDHDRVAAALVLEFMNQLGLLHGGLKTDYFQKRQIDLPSILAHEGYAFRFDQLRSMPLYDCCEEIIRTLHLQQIDTAYCCTFLGTVWDYGKCHHSDIKDFLSWFDEQEISSCTSSEGDAIKLMTIHKAKGLEAPIVLYAIPAKKGHPDFQWIHLPNDSPLQLPIGLVTTSSKDLDTLFSEQTDEERFKTEMDLINLLYVATTRPKEKLFIYCSNKKKIPNYYGNLLCQFAKSNDGPLSQGATEGLFFFGNDDNKLEDNNTSVTGNTVDKLSSNNFPDWSTHITIATASIGEDSKTSEQQAFGIEMHDILAHIRTSDDIDKALEEFQRKHNPDADKCKKIREQITTITQSVQCRKFFDSQYEVHTECEILHNGDILRPDRVVISPNEVWIIDYKTGGPNPSYFDQVNRYKQAFNDMGYTSVKGFLLYTTEFSLVEC